MYYLTNVNGNRSIGSYNDESLFLSSTYYDSIDVPFVLLENTVNG